MCIRFLGRLSASTFTALSLISFDTSLLSAQDRCILNFDTKSFDLGGSNSVDTDQYSSFEHEPANPYPAKSDVKSAASRDCGHATSLLKTFPAKNNVITLNVAGGTLDYMPIALYNKFTANCNHIKVRSACFEVRSIGEKGFEIDLYDKYVTSKGQARFIIDSYGNIRGISKDYALIKAQIGQHKSDLMTRIRNRVSAFEENAKSCTKAPGSLKCLESKEAVAESVILERIRAERFHSITNNQREEDRKEFCSRFNSIVGIRRTILQIMMKNELAERSPYELTDATTDKSGLSFGVHQLDIGNDDRAKKIFRHNLRSFENSEQWRAIPIETRNFAKSQSFTTPIREYTVKQLLMLHQIIPTLNSMMHSPKAIEQLDLESNLFLSKSEELYNSLLQRCVFKADPLLAAIIIDQDNQRPKNTSRLKNVASSFDSYCKAGILTESKIKKAEKSVIDEIEEKFRYRSDNVLKILEGRSSPIRELCGEGPR